MNIYTQTDEIVSNWFYCSRCDYLRNESTPSLTLCCSLFDALLSTVFQAIQYMHTHFHTSNSNPHSLTKYFTYTRHIHFSMQISFDFTSYFHTFYVTFLTTITTLEYSTSSTVKSRPIVDGRNNVTCNSNKSIRYICYFSK